MSEGNVAAEQLRLFIERIERLEEEKKGIADDIKDVYLEAKAKRMAQEERESESRTKAINQELEWIRSSPKARQAKSKARITAYEELLAKSQERSIGEAEIVIPPAPRLGNLVVHGFPAHASSSCTTRPWTSVKLTSRPP